MKTIFLSFLLVAAQPGEDTVQRADLKARLSSLIQETKTLSWFQKTWATNGKEEEKNSAECFWAGQEKMRLNVKEGRGSGATALYRDGKVTGFKPGLFSFVKVTYDVRDKEVLGVRGGDISHNGFMDDIAQILAQWPTVTIEAENEQVVLLFKNREGLPTKIWLAASTLLPSRIESYEDGKTVEWYDYEKIAINPKLDSKLFEP